MALHNPYLGTMKNIIVTLLLTCFSFMGAGTVSAQAADLMESLINSKRPVLLFAKSRSDARLDQQVDRLRDYRSLLKERDMVVLRITGNHEVQPAIGYLPIPAGSARVLRQRFEPDSKGLTVVLVGKDGTEKGRWQNVVNPQVLFDLIDSMPMRQQEMQGQQVVN